MGTTVFDSVAQELRFAARALLRTPAFTGAATLTLALGIGVTTAIFTILNTVILRPLPFAEPNRLVQLHGRSRLFPERDAVSGLDAYRRESTSFEYLGGYAVGARYLDDGVASERVMTVSAEQDFFSMLGVPALIGRTFHADDPPDVVVVAERFWRARLGSNPAVLDASLELDGRAFAIVGVMPESFQFPYGAASLLPGVASEMHTDVWLPIDLPLPQRSRFSSVTGRLKPGVSMQMAQGEVDAIGKRLATIDPETHQGRSVYVEPLSSAVVVPSVRQVMLLLFAGAGLLLGLMCANVTNLSLARASLRARDVAVRSALGASPARVFRHFLAESAMVSLAGTAGGCLLAWWGSGQLIGLGSPYVPRLHEGPLDWRVFVFLATTCTVVALAVGTVPAAMMARRRAPLTMTSVGHGTTGRAQRRVRDALVVAEIAVAFVLATGAAVLVRELGRLRNTEAGVDTANVLTVHVAERMTPQTDVRQFYDIEELVRQLSGVRAAGFTQLLPLQNWGWTSNAGDLQVGGVPESATYPIELRYVTPGYFDALGIEVVSGRSFGASDTIERPRVIIINETLARRRFASADPVGQSTNRGTIVGVIRDVRQAHLDRPAAPEVYFPIAQNWSQLSELGMTLVVRTVGPPEAMLDAVRTVVRNVNPRLAVFNAKSMDRVVVESLAEFTLSLRLVAMFAALALLLAVVGTYSVTSFLATGRTREFAIRIALGATHERVARLVLRDGLALAAAGSAVGGLLAMAATPLLRTLPVSIRPPDAVTTLPVVVAIAVLTSLACLLPAMRASRVDPMVALRCE